MVTLWKKQILEGAEMLFEKPGKDTEQHELEQKQDELYKQIGKLQIENDFLKKSTNNCTGPNRRYRTRSARIIDTRAVPHTGNNSCELLLQGRRKGRG